MHYNLKTTAVSYLSEGLLIIKIPETRLKTKSELKRCRFLLHAIWSGFLSFFLSFLTLLLWLFAFLAFHRWSDSECVSFQCSAALRRSHIRRWRQRLVLRAAWQSWIFLTHAQLQFFSLTCNNGMRPSEQRQAKQKSAALSFRGCKEMTLEDDLRVCSVMTGLPLWRPTRQNKIPKKRSNSVPSKSSLLTEPAQDLEQLFFPSPPLLRQPISLKPKSPSEESWVTADASNFFFCR